MLGGGAYALTHRAPPTPAPAPAVTQAPNPLPQGGQGQGGQGGGAMPNGTTLPPGHPPVGAQAPAGSNVHGGMPGAPGGQEIAPGEAEPAALRWKAPATWTKVPNANSFRLETYDIAHQPGDAENPQLTISRSGGDVEANLQRWIGQFDAEGQKTAKRAEKTLAGFKATVLEVQGKYAGMGTDGQAGYALLGAIVQTPGQAHFFKLTGPQKSVAAARADFDALLASLEAAK